MFVNYILIIKEIKNYVIKVRYIISIILILNHISGGTVGSYTLNAQAGAGAATINVRNNTAGALAEAVVIQFAVIKAVSS